jgi:SAM-dependent methyltransferase
VTEPRYARERDYHDKEFAERARHVVGKYYSVTQASRARYEELLDTRGRGKRVLEYGCGPGSYAFFLAERGASVTGIDISTTAIDQARNQARARGNQNVDFQVMNAESLALSDESFALVCGTAILHHLDLSRAFSELVRTMKPEGSGVFIEPLGHNPLINLYRRLTPSLRTVDEHPLVLNDLALAHRYFHDVEVEYFHLFSLLAVPFRRLPGFAGLVTALDTLERGVFRLLPFAQRWAWQVVLILDRPRRRPVAIGRRATMLSR